MELPTGRKAREMRPIRHRQSEGAIPSDHRLRPPKSVDHLGPIESCPGCGAHDFLAQEYLGAVVFQCQGCATSWRYELGYVWPVELTSVD